MHQSCPPFHHYRERSSPVVTPRVKSRLEEVQPVGDAHPVQSEFRASRQVFNAVCNDDVVFRVCFRISSPDSPNQSRFPIDNEPCACKEPAVKNILCGHTLTAAATISLNPILLVPYDLTFAKWSSQYPADTVPIVPNFSGIFASSVPRDTCLRVPVAAPPKRGRT